MMQPDTPDYSRENMNTRLNKKQTLRIDMTPMVDLGFLLISFFVFTTSMSEPSAIKLVMPKDKGVIDSSEIPESLTLTVLLDEKNTLHYCHGSLEKALQTGAVAQSGYSVNSGIGDVIRNKQRKIFSEQKFPEGKNEMMLLIKPSKDATYKNLVDILEEVIINDVKRYAIVELTRDELQNLKSKKTSGH